MNNLKKFKIFIFLICTLVAESAFAKPFLAFEPPAEEFLHSRVSLLGHRLHYQKTSMMKNFRKAPIVKVDSTNKTISSLKFILNSKFNVSENGKYSIRVKRKEGFERSLFKEKRLNAKENIPSLFFPTFVASQFDLLSVDTELMVDMESLEERVIGYVFNYQRMYNNRVVRSPYNYLTIAVDTLGKLKWADIAMEDFKITREFIKTEDLPEVETATLDSVIELSFSTFYKMDFTDSVRVETVNITSAAEAYCEFEEDEMQMLFPCISYTSRLSLENGDTVLTVIDAPHSLKTWRKFKNEKTSTDTAFNPLLVFNR